MPTVLENDPPQNTGINDVADLEYLERSFYNRDTQTVSRELLGKWLVHRQSGIYRIGRIVETEAYLGLGDLAAHTARGQTPRTKVMFGPPGYVYMYLVYGIHHLLNLVTEPEGTGTAVLIRALEPVANLSSNTNGPGKLTKAMGIDLSYYGKDLCSGPLRVAKPVDEIDFSTVVRPRVGVDYAGEWAAKPLRFYIEGNRFVSKK